jgi:hypothetical protein
LTPDPDAAARFGLTTDEWDDAKDEIRQAIIEAAWRRQTVTYGDVAERVTVVTVEPHSPLMSCLLGSIARDAHAVGEPVLTALVVHKHDGQPGGGFYDLAEELGYDFDEPVLFWDHQVQQVYARWGRPKRRR